MTVAKKRAGKSKGYFPRVAEARKVLADEALELYKLYKQIAVEALAAQEFATAEKAISWLLAHMPEDEGSGTMLNADIDKNQNVDSKGGSGPTIQIGLALGGMPAPKGLPEITVTDVTPAEDPDPS